MRGWYDVGGLRGDADVMLWAHAPTSEALQQGYHALLRTRLGLTLEPVWSQLALHRPAEFSKSHVPAFLADERARPYVCVYPFVRSYEWYLLPDEERRAMLVEHGMMGQDYPTCAPTPWRASRWGLRVDPGLRADELYRIVDPCDTCAARRRAATCARRSPSTRVAGTRLADLVGLIYPQA